jgi:hypothetical protein
MRSRLVLIVLLSLAGIMAGVGSASAVEPCRPNMVWAGDSGEIHADFTPSRFVRWGVRAYGDSGGLWLAFVMVGRRQVDRKEQSYPPHGSVNPKDLRSGQVLQFLIWHVESNGNKSMSRPDAECLIP